MSILYKAAARQAVLIGIKWKASNGFSWDILKANWFWPIFFLFTSPELCSADTLVLFASVEPRQSIPNLAVKLWRSWQTCWKSSRKHQLSARVIFFFETYDCFAPQRGAVRCKSRQIEANWGKATLTNNDTLWNWRKVQCTGEMAEWSKAADC